MLSDVKMAKLRGLSRPLPHEDMAAYKLHGVCEEESVSESQHSRYDDT